MRSSQNVFAQLKFGVFSVLAFLAQVVASLYLLARQFSPAFVGVLIAAYGMTALFALMTSLFGGSGYTRGWIFGAEQRARHPRAFEARDTFLKFLVFAAYPAGAGIVFFSHHVPSERLTFWVVALNGLLVLAGVVAQGTNAIILLGSSALDDETRTKAFYQQLGSVLVPALWLAVLYWASGFSEATTRFRVRGLLLTPSVPLLTFLIAFVLLTALGPYFVGAYRSRRQRLGLLSRQRSWLTKLLEVVEVPTAASYRQALRTIAADLGGEETEFTAEHSQIIELAEAGESSQQVLDQASTRQSAPTPPVPANVVKELGRMQETDSRLCYRHTLRYFGRVVRELVDEADAARTAGHADGKLELAESWTRIARERRAEAASEMDAILKRRLPVGTGSAFIATSVAGVVLDQAGNWLWSSIPGVS